MLPGDLDDLGSIRSGSLAADAVLHLANKHDWSNPAASIAAERGAVETIGEALAGTGKAFLLASGVAGLTAGRAATESDPSPFHGPQSPRGGTENLALSLPGVRSVALRFAPTVHGARDHGFIAAITAVARQKGVSGYPGDGTNRWAAVHRSDAGRLVALALESAAPGTRVHAVAEDGVPTREIADAIGAAVGVPVRSVDPDDVAEHFGWIGTFFGMDLQATSDATRDLLGWSPTGPTLLEDIAAGAYTLA